MKNMNDHRMKLDMNKLGILKLIKLYFVENSTTDKVFLCPNNKKEGPSENFLTLRMLFGLKNSHVSKGQMKNWSSSFCVTIELKTGPLPIYLNLQFSSVKDKSLEVLGDRQNTKTKDFILYFLSHYKFAKIEGGSPIKLCRKYPQRL